LERLITLTEDGSHTVLAKELNEHYHSTHGALQESMHIFIGAGLHQACMNSGALNILEIGFGTGLNALLTLADPSVKGRKVYYTTLEPYPIAAELAAELNYIVIPVLKPYEEDFLKMHLQPFGIRKALSETFYFTKLNVKAEESLLPASTYHLIYFDAFSPNIQPELWTQEVFTAIYSSLKSGGIMVTYCAKGSVKRILKAIGFRVESLPGPPGKSQITRAVKDLT
jgi:tRNA U34 5-methylaminomethyl-2-thiouridine-forming methyltransferase MnmC